jgi:hypothetical protein
MSWTIFNVVVAELIASAQHFGMIGAHCTACDERRPDVMSAFLYIKCDMTLESRTRGSFAGATRLMSVVFAVAAQGTKEIPLFAQNHSF